MIVVKFNGAQSFSGSLLGSVLAENIKCDKCIGFIDDANSEIYDLQTKIQGPGEFSVLTVESEAANKLLRASLGLILGNCMEGQIVDLQITDTGFTCKILTKQSISEKDFDGLKKKIIENINNNSPFLKTIKSVEESLEINPLLADEIEEGPNTWCKFKNCEVMTSLPILPNSSVCSKNFIIEKVAEEVYKDVKIQKITVAAFFKKEDLDDYINLIEKLKSIDHRVIGKKLDLFHFCKDSPGSTFWLPKGWKLFRKIQNYVRKYAYQNYTEVNTPILMSSEFWERSGHMTAFRKNMMHVHMGADDAETAAMKPMNCPAHIEIFATKTRSYKDLPIRIAEFGCCHRYEPSGALHGLLRVRSFNQDDGHIFCSKEQVRIETQQFMKTCLDVYKNFGFDDVKIIIATKPENALGEDADWEHSESELKTALDEINLKYTIAEGEGAFYGPKVEVHVKDKMQRSWQLGTIQLDFILAKRFKITYDDKDNHPKTPYILHRAMLGSLERFIAILLEHTEGNLPLHLAPTAISICSITDASNKYAEKIYNKLTQLGIECFLDIRPQTLAYKIRDSKTSKVPMYIVIGEKEIEKKQITIECNEENISPQDKSNSIGNGNKFVYDENNLDKVLELFI